jgi:hypothetical protein
LERIFAFLTGFVETHSREHGMPQDLWKAAPVGLGILVIALVATCPSGCSDAPPTANVNSTAVTAPSGSATQTADSKPTSASKPAAHHPLAAKPMLDGWAKPAIAIVLSGEQHGYMEPCGCSITQSGGLSRRADCFRQLEKEKGWPVTALDLGGLVKKDNEQNKLKFQVMLSALSQLGYKAMALGSDELQLEHLTPGFLFSQIASLNDNKSLQFVNNNVEFALFKDAAAAVATPVRILTVGGHKFGVTGVFGKNFKAKVFGTSADPQIAVKDPEETLPAAIAALKKEKPEFLVLLAHAERDEAVELAKKFPEFDIVVSSGPEEGTDTPRQIGKTLLLEVGEKGKHVGIVGYYPDDKKTPFRFELVNLDKERFKDTPAMLDRMREYQQMLVANYDAVMQDLPKAPAPGGDRFAGVESCKDCHKKAYGIWKDTKHAKAYETLITGREGTKNPISRIHDPECLCCHTTGWETQHMYRYDSGFYSLAKTPQLKGQQCENCHGPGAQHNVLEAKWKENPKSVNKEELEAARHRLHRTVDEAKKSLCYRCHDGDNDPNFTDKTFQEYWEQVEHHGKD